MTINFNTWLESLFLGIIFGYSHIFSCNPNNFVFWQEMQKQDSPRQGILQRRVRCLNGGVPDCACYNAMIEGLSNGNRAMDAFSLFEETRRKGLQIHTKTCVVLLDTLHKNDFLEQAATVGAVLRETGKARRAARSW